MEKPLVTVITVCYNAADTIEQTILSVLSQTYTNIEYIVVDGASSDGTVDIIEKYRERLSAFVSERDKGIYDAMNKAVELSHGKWINFMNSGDTFVDNSVIENVFANNFSDDIKVIYGDVVRCFLDGRTTIQHFDNLQKGNIQFELIHQSTFIDGDTMRELKYDIKYKISADANFFNEVYKLGGEFQYVPVVISNYESACGVSAKQLITLFNEYSDIKKVKKYSTKWLIGYAKIRVQVLLMKILPKSIFDRLIYVYVNRVAAKKTSR